MSKVYIDIYTDINKKDVANLVLQIQTNEFGIPISLEKQPDLNDIPGFYQTNNGNVWIAKIDTKIVGTIALLDIGNRQGALRKMFVDKNYRGKDLNVGKTLLNTLMDWAKHKGFTEIFLGTTEKFLAAQRFYEKNGFNEIEKRKLPRTFPVMEVDVKFYRITV